MDIQALGALDLPDHQGTSHRLRDLWQDQPVVMVFLRHFGWIHCREHAAQLRDHYDEIRSQGADIVAIGTGDARYAADFVEQERVPFLVLVDDDAAAANAASVQRASLGRLLAPTGWGAGLRAFKSGVRQHRSGKRPTQLGATFVIGLGDQVRYSHLDGDAADHAPVNEVLAALRN